MTENFFLLLQSDREFDTSLSKKLEGLGQLFDISEAEIPTEKEQKNRREFHINGAGEHFILDVYPKKWVLEHPNQDFSFTGDNLNRFLLQTLPNAIYPKLQTNQTETQRFSTIHIFRTDRDEKEILDLRTEEGRRGLTHYTYDDIYLQETVGKIGMYYDQNWYIPPFRFGCLIENPTLSYQHRQTETSFMYISIPRDEHWSPLLLRNVFGKTLKDSGKLPYREMADHTAEAITEIDTITSDK